MAPLTTDADEIIGETSLLNHVFEGRIKGTKPVPCISFVILCLKNSWADQNHSRSTQRKRHGEEPQNADTRFFEVGPHSGGGRMKTSRPRKRKAEEIQRKHLRVYL